MSDDLHSLAAVYVLDALDDDERRAFEAHLENCDACAADVADLREAGGLLPAALPPIAPPVDVRARVMAQIAATPQLPVVEPTPHDEPEGPVGTARPTPPAPTRTEQQLRRTGPPRWITLAAAAVVVVLLGFGAVIALGGDDPAPDPTELAIAELLETPDAVTVEMHGDSPGTLTVTYSAAEQRAVLVGDGLDAPGADRVYQLWTISGEQPTPSVVFTPDDGELAEQLQVQVAPPDAWAVTIEPAGGSPAPTGDILFQGTSA